MKSRPSALLDRLSSVPSDPEEARAFLQERLSRYAAFFAVIWLVTFPVDFIVGAATGKHTLAELMAYYASATPRWFHFATGIALVLGSQYLKLRGPRSVEVLAVFDALVVVVQCIVLGIFIVTGDPRSRPEIFCLLGITNILAVRAVLVPSAPRRTALVGACAVLSLAVAVVLLHARISTPDTPLSFAAVTVFVWGGIAVATSVLTSGVIYGLADRVRAAVELGQYRLVEKIGEGGMGRVYRAKHVLLRRPTAIKMLPADRNTDADLARFEREVQLTSKLSHPNIVAVYDFGRSPAGVFYYAMELLDGVDLDVLVDVDGPQPASRVLHILRQAADALADAHAIGLIHRDVKPANMVLSERNRRCDQLKIVDFGLVKSVSSSTGVGRSDVNVLKGTPLYMAPEAIVAPEEIDARTDLYALGAVGYFLLAGVPLFEGRSVVEVCGQHVHADPAPMEKRSGRAVPPAFEAVIRKCLAKKKDDRYADADALLAALDALTGPSLPRWTDAEAHAWWTSHRADLEARRKAAVPSHGTLAIAAQHKS